MTDCETCEARLLDLVEGELPDAERAAVEAHLAGCDGCRAALAETRALLGAYARSPEEDVSPAMGEAVLQAARQELARGPRAGGRGLRRVVPWPLAAAATLLLGWFLADAMDDGPGPDEDPAALRLAEGLRLERQGDLAGAVHLYQQALADPGGDDPALRHRVGRLYLAMERFDEASLVLTELIAAHPDYAARHAVRFQQGQALVGAGRLEEALASYAQVAQESPAARPAAELQMESIRSLMDRSLDGRPLDDPDILRQLRELGYLGDP